MVDFLKHRLKPIFSDGIAWFLIKGVRLYQLTLSYWLGRACRFRPTCSHYMIEAIQTHGPARGTYLGLNRICRCNPFCKSGYDPVPPKKSPKPS